MHNYLVELHQCTTDGRLNFNILFDENGKLKATTECEVIDFKRQLPTTDAEYAKLSRDLIALHNSYGGFIVFGIAESIKDRKFELVGTNDDSIKIDKLRMFLRNYTDYDIRISSQTHAANSFNTEAIWVAKRTHGDSPVRFAKNGPDDAPRKPCFKRGEVVFRRMESNAIATSAEDYDFLYSSRRPPSLDLSVSDLAEEEPIEHNLPDRSLVCSRFVGRREDLADLWEWLSDDFSRVRLVAGEGGLGKTSLAYRFAEEVASRRVRPFDQVVWLSAKKKQFIPSENAHRENPNVDFSDAESLFKAIASANGCINSEFEGLDSRDLQRLALSSCEAFPSFIVVDDVDSLSPEDQTRALELGMRIPPRTKMLLTTRVNFSYSPDNVLKLNGLPADDFQELVTVARERYNLAKIRDSKVNHLREVTGGSPLFTDSLLRLERRGLNLDQAINQWRGEKGLEARKAALQREIQQLSREAKRTLFVICHVRNASYVELSQILSYTDQTLGDALHELTGLFLINAPAIGTQARYTVDSNTGALVLEIANSLGIDHAALVSATKRARSDAIGLTFQRRSGLVGQAISQAIALSKQGDAKAALDAIKSTAKRISPHADLLLAQGRFSLKLDIPDREQACKALEEAYLLGQRKRLLFDLWFEAEYGRGRLDPALDVTVKAIDHEIQDGCRWYERRAQVYVAKARRSSQSSFSIDAALREVDLAINELKLAKKYSSGEFQRRQMEQLLDQAQDMRTAIAGKKLSK